MTTVTMETVARLLVHISSHDLFGGEVAPPDSAM